MIREKHPSDLADFLQSHQKPTLPFRRFRSQAGLARFVAPILCGLLLAALPARIHSQPASDQPAALQGFTELWALASAEDTRDHVRPLDVEGTVLYFDPEWHLLWFSDRSGSNYLNLADTDFDFQTGDRVRLSGQIVPSEGLSSKRVSVETLQENALPHPLDITPQLDAPTRANLRYASLEGYVDRQFFQDINHAGFRIIAEGKSVDFRLRLGDDRALPKIVGAFVRVQGVFVVTPGQTGQPDGLALWSDVNGPIELIDTPYKAAFFAEPAPIEQLAELPRDQLVKVSGLVYQQTPEKQLTVRDESGQLVIDTPQASKLESFSLVEVVGYPEPEGAGWTLRNALYRRVQNVDRERLSELANKLRLQYRLAEQVLHLAPKAITEGHSAHLQGVVTHYDRDARVLYLNDRSAGIRVELEEGSEWDIHFGDAIEVKGDIIQGPFSPAIKATSVVVAGTVSPPEPVHLSYDQAITGYHDAQWVEVLGQVETTRQEGLKTELLLSTPHGDLRAVVHSLENAYHGKIGANVQLRGVLEAKVDSSRRLESVVLQVPDRNLVVEQKSVDLEPFQLPLTPIGELGSYRPFSEAERPVRIQGTVTYHSSGKALFIQNGNEVVRAYSRNQEKLQPNDMVDVVGYPLREGERVSLRNSIFRKIGRRLPLAPEMLDPKNRSIDVERDGHLVTYAGRLLNLSATANETRFVLQNGRQLIEAIGDRERFFRWEDSWKKGATLAVSGVYKVDYNRYSEPEEATILLRDESDITILRNAPWWSPARILLAGALGVIVLCAAAAWSFLLRKQVSRQTNLIRHQVEREALMQEQHREILRNSSDFIFTLDFEGKFTSYNRAGETITGFSVEESRKMTIFDLIDDRQKRLLKTILDRRIQIRSNVFETQILHKDGSLRWVEVCAGLLKRKGKALSGFGVMHDIQKRKLVEEELKRARDAAEENTKAKSNFLATMSHELRTPMNGIIGMTGLLLDHELDDQAREFAETIRGSACSLLVLLNDILDLSKAEAGKLTVDPHPFKPREAVEQTLTLLETTAHSKNLELLCLLPDDLPETLVGDAGRLRQVLLNLIGNAIKFTEVGNVTLNVTVDSEEDRHAVLRFEIRDTGIGVPETAKDKLFQPFVQADASHSRRFGGTGLGLKISQEIVTLMGGDIGLSSEEGKGSTFWFTTRLEKPDTEQHQATPIEAPETRKSSPKLQWHGPELSVLIADDMPVNQRVTKLQLKKMGIKSDIANNGLEVLEAIAQKSYDIIFMDCQMPEMDGFEATSRIRAKSEYDGIYIVALTANAMKGDRDRCIAVGMNDYVSKPTRPDKLLEAIESFARQTESK
ncbi:ATP-binding protein [Pelagicoccus sp. SDUM812003]|uniref:hybrid sensor histidine kinase/response regulator n=1 Tax=Pelagicoccus sp. SDUM812003 TaxID=3041267 RepID=UPI00280EE864|nr:ATP-binding protein [Pelagicoccus sp. SDUM812003]MDQ8205239.1 ATP-binding protein [Pelagicoccus sp. SDUM812003]